LLFVLLRYLTVPDVVQKQHPNGRNGLTAAHGMTEKTYGRNFKAPSHPLLQQPAKYYENVGTAGLLSLKMSHVNHELT
jgi:hypothetical protein